MRTRLLIAVATATLIAGCQQKAPEVSNDTAATNAVAPADSAPGKTNAVLGPAASGDQAKTLMHDRHEGMEDI